MQREKEEKKVSRGEYLCRENNKCETTGGNVLGLQETESSWNGSCAFGMGSGEAVGGKCSLCL